MEHKLFRNWYGADAEKKHRAGRVLAAVSVFAVMGMLLLGCGASGKQTQEPAETVVTETQVQPETEEASATEPVTEIVPEPAAETEPEPVTVPQLETEPEAEAPGTDAEISQVLPMEDGSVAVLYTDGVVRVSGNAHFAEEVSDWEGVTRLYYDQYSVFDGEPILVGVTENNGVVTTEEDIPYPHWGNAAELHFPYWGIVAVTENGAVDIYGGSDFEYREQMTELKNVKDLVYSDIQDIWCILKKDGSVQMLGDYIDPSEICWKNVKEVRDSGHSFYVIKKNGTVAGIEKPYAGLNGAVKLADYNDCIFGLSAGGRLLTHNGGNIYVNTGDMVVDVPGLTYYSGEVDISRFNKVKDILGFEGLVLLNKDGTAEAFSYAEWDLSNWNNIEKIYGCSDQDWNNLWLYGIRKDGTVIRNQFDLSGWTETSTDNFGNWKLSELYEGNGGVVGLTVDGELVGDGIYENLDFSVFER